MIVSLALMVLGSLTIGIGSIIAMDGLHQDLSATTQGYRQLRQLYDVGFLASKAREAISANPPQPTAAVTTLRSALSVLNARSTTGTVDGPPDQWVDESARSDCRSLLNSSIDEMERGSPNPTSLNLLFGRMSKTSDQVRQSIFDAQTAADRKRGIALLAISTLCALVVMIAVAIGIRQYRRVMRPVGQITAGVRAFAGGQFDRRIDMIGDREFIALAADFNRMADDLSALYQDLQQKVDAKSKQLLRSERLAGVGYLAAGVAHEINNPLGIIAGYSERAMQQFAAGSTDDLLPRTQKALAVICEETFRCKQIIDRLLSLARPGAGHRQIASIATIADNVVTTLSGLGVVGKRTLKLMSDPAADLSVLVDEGEMKQLLLNLIINAVEATDPTAGKVTVSIDRRDDNIELSVRDNGQGMTTATLDQIFQPFFTDKRGQRPGTGLGLSIAHAIVTDHGGRITAHSDGPGAGSTFTVSFTAAKKEPALATS
jgi:two-component system NtrC family sensor kinase